VSIFSPNEEKKDFVDIIQNTQIQEENNINPIKKVSFIKQKPRVAKIKTNSNVAMLNKISPATEDKVTTTTSETTPIKSEATNST